MKKRGRKRRKRGSTILFLFLGANRDYGEVTVTERKRRNQKQNIESVVGRYKINRDTHGRTDGRTDRASNVRTDRPFLS